MLRVSTSMSSPARAVASGRLRVIAAVRDPLAVQAILSLTGPAPAPPRRPRLSLALVAPLLQPGAVTGALSDARSAYSDRTVK